MSRTLVFFLFFCSSVTAFSLPMINVVSEATSMRTKLGNSTNANIYIINNGNEVAFVDGFAMGVSSGFSVLPGVTLPYQLAPTDTLKITVKFAPTKPCEEQTIAILRTTGLNNKVDTTLKFLGIGLAQKLSTKDPNLHLGTQFLNQSIDSTSYDFVGVYDFSGNLDNCLGSTTIDSIVINDPTNSFQLTYPALNTFPRTYKVGQFLTFTLRFQPKKIGNLFADMKLYFAGSPDSVRKVRLSGRCYDEYIKLGAALGSKKVGKPGDLIRVPIVLTSDVARANLNLLEITLKFKKTVLKPKAVYAKQSGATAEPVLPYRFDDPFTAGIARIRLTHKTFFNPGNVAEVEFAVMIGDTQSTYITYSDIKCIYRPEVTFNTDSVLFTQDEFCDKPERIINYNRFTSLFAKQTNNELTINFYQPEYTPNYEVQVYNERGSLVKSAFGSFSEGTQEIKFDASDFYSGRYFIIVKREDLIEKTKLVIAH